MGQAKGSSPKRGGRPRAGQEALSRGRILDAALRLVDEEGMGALSMRRLGAELGVNPMSIYHHLPGKGAVVSGLVGYASIWFLLRFLREHSTGVFIGYRLVLGGIILALLASGLLDPLAGVAG